MRSMYATPTPRSTKRVLRTPGSRGSRKVYRAAAHNYSGDVGQNEQNTFSDGTMYQIYPRSFKDSNGDGIGDLQGIIQRLPYLNGDEDSLGINAIWLSPFYPSPGADFGYDVADYCDIDPIFGSLADFHQLIAEAHERGIRILIDLVPSHCSDEHPWFQESKSSQDNPKRDWFTWRDPRDDGSLPNNWLSHFGGPAWEWDESSGQYYLHSFLKKQADLNWDNPQVREAMKDVMRFWLDMGVDGFRVDWVPSMSKDPQFRDEEPNPHYDPTTGNNHDSLQTRRCANGPKLYEYLSELASVLAEYDNRFMVTESYPEECSRPEGYLGFYENVDPLHSAPFNFGGLFTPWDAQAFRTFIGDFQAEMKPGYVSVLSISNHDNSRPATRFGPNQARTLAMMTLTMPGVPTIYYGDEIGMHDVQIASHQQRDPAGINEPGKGLGRDPERTPMQWDATPHSGFTEPDVSPWLPVAADFIERNVSIQRTDPESMFSLYQQLIAVRNAHAVLRAGEFKVLSLGPKVDPLIFAFTRNEKGHADAFATVLNFSASEVQVPATHLQGRINISTHARQLLEVTGPKLKLAAHEGLLIQLV